MNIMAGFAAYQLMNMSTGQCLYKTTATASEIHRANENLQNNGYFTRFVPLTDLEPCSAPSLLSA